jgi:hypothetical protein
MRCLFVLLALVLTGCADVTPPPAPGGPGTKAPSVVQDPPRFPENFNVIFTREYGMWKYETCVLQIELSVDSNQVSLVCRLTKGGDVSFVEQLSPIRAGLLRELVESADLYGPDHAGQDSTPGDGIFETLRLQPAGGGRAAVVVTSGNHSFVEQQPRRELLRLLAQIEADCRRQGDME